MPPAAIIESALESYLPVLTRRKVARVLLVDNDLASRLTLKSLLAKAGYAVEGAASSAEAISRLDGQEYQLVLADLRNEPGDAGPSLLTYARQKEYRPATALISSDMRALRSESIDPDTDRVVTMSNEDVSNLLISVAELISLRADRRMRRASHAA